MAPMSESRWKSPSTISGLAGSGASALVAIVFALQHSLNQTEWFVLMTLAIFGFCSTANRRPDTESLVAHWDVVFAATDRWIGGRGRGLGILD
jgi:hypothetical protein